MDPLILSFAVVNGLLQGGIYGGIALGLSLIFGVLRVVNFAHGSFLMLSLYLSFWCWSLLGMDPYLSALVTVPTMFLLGYLVQRLIISPLIVRERALVVEPLSALLLTCGIFLVVDNLALMAFGPDVRSVQLSYYMPSVMLGPIPVDTPRLIAAASSIGVAVAVSAWLRYSHLGRAIRATAQNRDAAAMSGIDVPQVYAVGSDRDYSFVVMEYLPPRPLDAHNAFLLGQQLAHLHQWSDQPQFGLDFDNDLSTTPQPNAWQRRWSVFFAEQRIGWQLELAAEKGLHFGDIDTLVDVVQQRLANHQPQPSLLHGDLWSGNCALGPDGPYIFDPACYWGDRECDLAMLPMHPEQPPQIYDGYQSVSPLPAGFLDRQPIYQLYTLLNRAILFGGQHLVTVQQALDDVLTEKTR